MSQQHKIRPSRAERARQKTRVPNLPTARPPLERHFEPAPASVAPAVAPVRSAPRPGEIQDYSYVGRDLVRIAVISGILLVLMVALAFVIR
ncbi:MAG: hypothetical protein HY689_04560 [Chloroflexi bacterium]|nr:hypothetical protein [Chloroflexota bacterium]